MVLETIGLTSVRVRFSPRPPVSGYGGTGRRIGLKTRRASRLIQVRFLLSRPYLIVSITIIREWRNGSARALDARGCRFKSYLSDHLAGQSSGRTRQAHNLYQVGSIPTHATINNYTSLVGLVYRLTSGKKRPSKSCQLGSIPSRSAIRLDTYLR